MLTLIAPQHPRLSLFLDAGRSRPWKGVIWHSARCGASHHAAALWNRGAPILRWGRPLSVPGAFYREEEYLGLCAVEDFDAAPSAPEFREFALRLTRTFMDVFGFGPEKVLGHHETMEGVIAWRPCPERFWDMELFRREL